MSDDAMVSRQISRAQASQGPVTSLLNFAYGSNMLSARLRERTPSARPLGTAILRGHGLRWHKVAADGSGKCDIIPVASAHSIVHGVVYEIPLKEKCLLDQAEGLGHGYGELIKTVEMNGEWIDVQAYVALRIRPDIHPYSWYRALVVAGAIEHGLPSSYVDVLRRVWAVMDPDQRRHAMNMELAGEG